MGVCSGSGEDSDSDETIVEGSVAESDVEEEEFRWRRGLPFLGEDVDLTTETRIHKGIASPEICFIPKFSDHTYSQKQQQINPILQEAYTSDQSQSLLQCWIKCPSLTENISKSGSSLNAAVEGHQNNSVGQEAFGRNSVNPVCPISLSVIHRRNLYGETLLHRAVFHQDVDLVCNIIKAGGNVNIRDYAGWSALHTASLEGSYRIANELLKAGADVDAKGYEQVTPLQDAAKEGHYEIVENMQKETFQKTDEGVFALVSRTKGSENNGDKVNAKINVLSELTETEVQSKRIRLDPQETNRKAASYSSSSKTNLSSRQSQFSQASGQQTFKKSGAGRKTTKKRNTKGETQLHIAARRGNLSLVKTLISSGICVNEQDNAGWTAIHEASNRGFTEVILELLKAGANVNSRSLDGILPIHDAVSGNYLEATRVLLQHGANPCERSNSGKSALDEAHDDEMSELLKSYGAMDSLPPVDTIEVTGTRDPSRSRRSKHPCYSYCENDNEDLEPQCEKYSVEPAAAIQDAEEKQKELLLLELRTSKDADMYIQRLSQVQDTLNEMLAKQKTERDTLAKKYRASVESFKKGALRKQLVNLASRQKSLLTVAQNQEKLVQKIQNYRKAKQVFSASCSEKQISNSIISCGDDERQSLTADEIVCPDVVTFSMGLGASMPNGNRVEAHLPLENEFPAQDCSQHPHICLDETGANKEAIRSKEAFDHALASESRVREYPFDNMSKLTNAVEVVTLPSEPAVSTNKTKCSQQKDIDCIAIAEQGNKSLNPTSMTNVLNIVEPRSTVVNNNVCQPDSDCQQVLTREGLQIYINEKEDFQQQQQQRIILSKSANNFPNTLQQMIFQYGENSFNANLVLSSHTSNTDYPLNLSEKSSQSYSNQACEQIQVRCGRRNKKKLQLIDLLELGKIKPGENVLEFKLQEFSRKATLLNSGKIRTSKRQIMQNPVHWVKDLLGNDIYVTWKYAWNKVTYLGTQLSKFLDEGVSVSKDPELPSQERMLLGKNFIMRNPTNHNKRHQSPGTISIAQPLGTSDLSNMQPKRPSLPQTEVAKTCTEREAAVTRKFKSSSVQFNSVESLAHFLQFHDIVMVPKEEFLPCTAMEKYWNFYKGCKDFGF
ncbi:ankyrin repeat domain-containing protein 31 isoform X8 [Strigops habroptila]|uniref:ankyrin repeat domain-containing protein 31 isoform X8 n=1 Tax=Strigops habroptila TaxID=2489341 RepID=UPI0011CF3233|nr:ankyrin repeat domain-containing protein 31 isoform X8 [Strigops habroptila]